jgi:hypothetical protein
MQPANQTDHLVLEKVRRSPNGASSIEIAIASLGSRARKHSKVSLDLIGLSIAARLVGAGMIQATRQNRFTVKEAA